MERSGLSKTGQTGQSEGTELGKKAGGDSGTNPEWRREKLGYMTREMGGRSFRMTLQHNKNAKCGYREYHQCQAVFAWPMKSENDVHPWDIMRVSLLRPCRF